MHNGYHHEWVRASLLPVLLAFLHTALAANDTIGRDLEPDPYQNRILQQIAVISPRPEQLDAFRAELRAYFRDRNGSLARVSRRGGGYAQLVRQDLSQCNRRAMKAMQGILDEEQLEHYRVLLGLATDQYLSVNKLL